MKITLILPTLNEIDGMKAIMPLISPDWYDQLIVLDGGSTDGTIEFAKEMGLDVHAQREVGLHNAYMEIYDRIEGDAIMFFSPDGNSVAELVPQLRQKNGRGL